MSASLSVCAKVPRVCRWLGGVLFILPFAPDCARAATFTADTVADATDASPGDGACVTATGMCSLRAAIQEANALPGADSIVVSLVDNCTDRYVLSLAGADEDAAVTGDLDILEDVTISAGPASPVAGCAYIEAGGLDRIFDVIAGVVAIQGLGIRDGYVTSGGGGAIANAGALTITECSFTSNVSEADDGGAVFNTGTLSIDESEFTHNDAQDAGGAIANDGGNVVVRSSVLRRNVASMGAAISNANGGTVHIVNVTLTQNGHEDYTGGAILNATGSTVTLSNASVVANAGIGILNQGSITLKNTLVAENEPSDCSGVLTSAGHNLVGSCTLSGDLTGNIVGVDPGLGGWREVRLGVPVSVGIAGDGVDGVNFLLPGSPAIDAGDPAGCTDHLGAPLIRDQLNAPRSLGAACDIGAYEVAPTCVGGPALQNARLKIAKMEDPAGDERLVFSGELVDPLFQSNPPSAAGVQFQITDLAAPAFPLLDFSPTTTPISSGCLESDTWTTTGGKKEFLRITPDEGVRGPDGGCRDDAGLQKLLILDRQDGSGLVRFKAVTRGSVFQDVSGALSASVAFGGYQESFNGRCGELAFNLSQCAFNGSGSTLKCR